MLNYLTIMKHYNFTRLVFLGGCHVVGYPLNEAAAFSSLVSNKLQFSDTRKIFLSLDNSILFLESNQLEIDHSLVVLQIGHFECSNSIFNFSSKLKTSPSMNQSNDHMHSRYFFQGARQMVRFITYFTRRLLSFPRFDSKQFQKRASVLLDILKRNSCKVLIVSSFPTNNFIDNYDRRTLNIILQELSERYMFPFLNVYDDLIIADRLNDGGVLIDSYHLNELGHQLVAGLIVRKLLTNFNLLVD